MYFFVNQKNAQVSIMVIELYPQEDPQPIDIFDRNCILIVDQNRTYVDHLAKFFNQQNFQVLTHTSGELGFDNAKRSLPDCILLNTELVDMDGISLCQQIVDDSQTCGIPVIMMGEGRDPSELKSARSAGCQFFVSKPIDPRTLVFLVNESIAEARSWILD